jgi:uncharacterized membrane protein (UPF0127 family)
MKFSRTEPSPPRRFAGASRKRVGRVVVPVASGRISRLLGLSLLERSRAGTGLLIPRCRAVHTFGMRFALDLRFLDGELREVSRRTSVPPRRVAFERSAAAVLELPAGDPA